MKLKVDENLPANVSDLLCTAGHDAISAVAPNLGGKPDREIAHACLREERALITLDVDFADITAYPPSDYHGILVFGLKRQDKSNVFRVLQRLLPLLSQASADRQLWIIEEERIRIRE